jgi:hypothetical protein
MGLKHRVATGKAAPFRRDWVPPCGTIGIPPFTRLELQRMNESPKLEKALWDHSDFERIEWHDCTVHALALEPNSDGSGTLLVDLDYIVRWVQPIKPSQSFSFWITPATLIFENAWGLDAELSEYAEFRLELDRIERSEPDQFGRRWWTLDGHLFTVRLLSPGFTQVLRHEPIASK